MCCFSPVAAPVGFFARLFGSFSSPKLEVSGTRIFARVDNGAQHLVYSMSLATPSDVAMVLPLPVARGAGESALTFVDLSGYKTFFDDMSKMVMPPEQQAFAKGGLPLRGRSRQQLVVHTVGAFDASFVPSIGDFDRLDRRFRLPDEVWAEHREYGDRAFGFAVFKLRKSTKKSVHPMALSFPTSEPDSIFFPTLHVHDGRTHPRASFDHWLYHQRAEDVPAQRVRADGTANYEHKSWAPARDGMRIDLACGFVHPDQHIFGWSLAGELANSDTRITLGAKDADRRAA